MSKRKVSNDDNLNRDIVKWFFKEKKDNPGVWVCQCSIERKQAEKTGYSNLMSHLRSDHKNYEQTYKNSLHNSNLDKFFSPSDKAIRIYGWIDWIITDRYFFYLFFIL